MSRSDPYRGSRRPWAVRFGGPLLAAALLCTACGLAEDEGEERDSRVYLRFDDEAFAAYCLDRFDTNGDGRLSRYEAQRVREMDCSGTGIASLDDIGEFRNLTRLDCSGNRLRRLDLTDCTLLEAVDCAGNELAELDVAGLRSLRSLDCRTNRLARLDLQSNSSLTTLDCRENRLTTLDLASCAVSLRADVRANPSLTTVYYRPGQQIASEAPATLVER